MALCNAKGKLSGCQAKNQKQRLSPRSRPCHREADPSCPAAKQKTKNKGCHREADPKRLPSKKPKTKAVTAKPTTVTAKPTESFVLPSAGAWPHHRERSSGGHSRARHRINDAFKLDPQSSWHSATPKVSCPAAKQKTKNKGCHREADPVTAKPTQAVRLPSKKPKTKAVTAKPTGCHREADPRLSPRSRPRDRPARARPERAPRSSRRRSHPACPSDTGRSLDDRHIQVQARRLPLS